MSCRLPCFRQGPVTLVPPAGGSPWPKRGQQTTVRGFERSLVLPASGNRGAGTCVGIRNGMAMPHPSTTETTHEHHG